MTQAGPQSVSDPTFRPKGQNDSTQSGAPLGAEAIAGEPISTDICVIGAGAGGLTVAAAAVAFGRSVTLVAKHRMGSESLMAGALPTKAFLASANRAHAMRTAASFGIGAIEPQIDPRAVQQHLSGVLGAVAVNNTAERFGGLGVRVIQGAARFLDKRTVLAGDYRITARRFVIATGSSPLVPAIPGLETCAYFTSETIFENDRKVPHLVVVGGGATAFELAQAHLRLGSRVTVLADGRALPDQDPEVASVAIRALLAEGVAIRENVKVERVEGMTGFVRLDISTPDGADSVNGSHLLLAIGRSPNVSDLNLEAAGIKYEPSGITVNAGLRTSNRRIYAIGDVTGGPQATHLANHHAEVILRRALFWLPARAKPALAPRIVFTDPEIAHVGLSEDEARAAGHKINVLRSAFSGNDRAIAEHETQGHLKVVTNTKGRILGASIVGAGASEQIHLWALAVANRLSIKAVTRMIAPYPTLGETARRAALRYSATTPANPTLRKLIGFLAKLG